MEEFESLVDIEIECMKYNHHDTSALELSDLTLLFAFLYFTFDGRRIL
jgi:hypothetical protein